MNFDVTHRNALYAMKRQEGVKGQGPMVIALLEGANGGHAIGTYNRQRTTLGWRNTEK